MIYFLRAAGGDLVKIGFTENEETLRRRIAALQTNVPWKLELLRKIPDGTRDQEAWFHKHFAWAHSHGEWFVYTPMLLTTYPPQPEFDARLRKRAAAREILGDIVERLIDLMDQLTPDVERETDLADYEPEADMYLRMVRPMEAQRVTWDDCDQEASTVPLEPEEAGNHPLFGIEHARAIRVVIDPATIRDHNWLMSPSQLPDGTIIATRLEFPVNPPDE